MTNPASSQANQVSPASVSRAFMTAEWRHLVMRNYEVDPGLLRDRVPRGTELDFWNGSTYLSLVGFRFLNTRLKGWRIPYHVNFDEVNLRFYVRFKHGNEWRRGVVFIKEIVPLPAVTFVARWVYNENYVTMPMRSHIQLPDPDKQTRGHISYRWRGAGSWYELSAKIEGTPSPLVAGTQEEFITEHYWGYVVQKDGSTLEYKVEHPPWRVWQATESQFSGDVTSLYGPEFSKLLSGPACSSFVADGSEIIVRDGRPTLIRTDASSVMPGE